jgi:CubicO group peptidase (beta-lactamase class C family)
MNFVEQVRTVVAEKAQVDEFSGVVAIWQADEPLMEHACGLAHRGWQIANRLDTRFRLASVSKMFTAVDLWRFSEALRNGRLLSPASTEAMLKPHIAQSDGPISGYLWQYGFGNEFVLSTAGEFIRWGHTGEEDGVSCRFYHYPDQVLDVIILGNQSWCAGSLGWEIHDLIGSMA